MRTSAPPHFVAVDGGLRFCHDGASQRFFCGPAGAKSVLEYTARQSEALLPFNKRAGCSVKRQPHIVASVAMLLSVCRPAAVAWLVIAIVVDAVNRFSCRALAHVGKEVLKFQPPPAHFDAACTVATETSRLWILTPLQHAGPYPVCCSRLVTNVMSVFRRSLFYLVSGELCAPTGNSLAASKMACGCECFDSTITNTSPQNFPSNTICG